MYNQFRIKNNDILNTSVNNLTNIYLVVQFLNWENSGYSTINSFIIGLLKNIILEFKCGCDADNHNHNHAKQDRKSLQYDVLLNFLLSGKKIIYDINTGPIYIPLCNFNCFEYHKSISSIFSVLYFDLYNASKVLFFLDYDICKDYIDNEPGKISNNFRYKTLYLNDFAINCSGGGIGCIILINLEQLENYQTNFFLLIEHDKKIMTATSHGCILGKLAWFYVPLSPHYAKIKYISKNYHENVPLFKGIFRILNIPDAFSRLYLISTMNEKFEIIF